MKIGQSSAIERYIAHKCGLMGSNEEEAAIIECTVDHVNDIKGAFRKVRDMPDGDSKTEELKAFYSTHLPTWLGKLEKSLLYSQANDCSVGNQLTYSDVAIWHLCNEFFKYADIESAVRANPKIEAISRKVASHPQVKKWLAERPVTVF